MSRLLKIYRNRNYEWPEAAPVPARTIEQRPIEVSNLQQAVILRSPQVADTFKRFIDRGRYGVFAMLDDVAVGHAWVTRPDKYGQIANGYARLAPRESLIHYCFVSAGHRGRGLYAEMLHEVTAWALGAGAVRVLVDTSIENAASQKGIQRAGFREIERTTSVVVGRQLVYTRHHPQLART